MPAVPRIAKELSHVSDLVEATVEARDADRPACSLLVNGQTADHVDLARLELSSSHLLRCSFLSSDMSNATFEDVCFEQCDFSNSDFSSSYFLRCAFVSCRFVGTDFSESAFKHVSARESTFQYASFVKGRFDTCRFDACDFSEASMPEVELKRFEMAQSRFTNVDLFRTSLRDVDLSDNDIAGFLVSDTLFELKGCTMDLYQAASVARKLGIIVKE